MLNMAYEYTNFLYIANFCHRFQFWELAYVISKNFCSVHYQTPCSCIPNISLGRGRAQLKPNLVKVLRDCDILWTSLDYHINILCVNAKIQVKNYEFCCLKCEFLFAQLCSNFTANFDLTHPMLDHRIMVFSCPSHIQDGFLVQL